MPEFAEKKFRRSRSLHTRRYTRPQYAEKKGIGGVDEESVYLITLHHVPNNSISIELSVDTLRGSRGPHPPECLFGRAHP
jgi:hypothetical protein